MGALLEKGTSLKIVYAVELKQSAVKVTAPNQSVSTGNWPDPPIAGTPPPARPSPKVRRNRTGFC